MAIALAATGAVPALAGNGNSSVIGDGPNLVRVFDPPAPNPFSDATVVVSAAEIGKGNLQITLDVQDVDAPAGTTFGAHVHTTACGADPTALSLGAGPHYTDTNDNGSLERREIWLDFTLDANGRGHAVATRQFRLTPSAERSVVIHALSTDQAGMAGTRLACTTIDAI